MILGQPKKDLILQEYSSSDSQTMANHTPINNIWCPICQKGVTGIDYEVYQIKCSNLVCWPISDDHKNIRACKDCKYSFVYEDFLICKGCDLKIPKSLNFCPGCGYQTKDIKDDFDVRRIN